MKTNTVSRSAAVESSEERGMQVIWNEFSPCMESSLFRTNAVIGDTSNVTVLIDNGSESYAIINEELARRLELELLPIEPRAVSGVIKGPVGHISHVTRFALDVGGFKDQRVFAYVLPGQSEDLILGRPWLQYHDATLREKTGELTFFGYDTVIRSNDTIEKTFPILGVKACAFAAVVRREKRERTGNLEVFAASLADVERALRPKVSLTRAEVIAKLPSHYVDFVEVFDPKEAQKLPPNRPGVDQEICLEEGKEVPWGPLYNMSRDELLVLRKELTSLLDKDFIRASKSPAGAPVLFAKKPGGGLRFCVDYRGLNAVTKKDRYPLPLIRETLAALNTARWLTKLDVSAAFHRIRIAKGEEWKTAFRTRYGLYEWNVSPFGLANSPATFQRYINWCLREYLDDFCSAYVDDILIFSSGSLDDHRSKVRRVLGRLRECGLQLDISKCEFETKSTKYLGYIIDVGRGIRMDPEKLTAIRDWTAPKTVKAVRSFLGFANYYRLFIKDYADVAKPLTDLTKKGIVFDWSESAEAAFQKLKQCFGEEPVLATYDPGRKTRLEPDASGWAVGGVFNQFDTALQAWRPVAFFSARHSPAECNYDIHDKELLAIVKCMKQWSGELRGLSSAFTILTDHRNLEPFTTKKTLNERQVRWSEFLAGFNFQLVHRPGKEATIPDALSRREQDVPEGSDDSRIALRNRTLLPEDLWVGSLQLNTTSLKDRCPFSDEGLVGLWREAIRNDDSREVYQGALEAVQKGERSFPPRLGLHMTIGDCSIGDDGLLRYRDRLWIPSFEPLTTALIQRNHDSLLGGHPGRDAQLSMISRQFYWPGISQHIRQFVKNCDVCGNATIWRDKKKGLLRPLPLAERLWSEISMDFVTDLPPAPSSSTVICVITDRFGKGTMLLEVSPDQFTAEGFASLFISRYVSQHWIPQAITSDRGVQFVNAFWRRLCELLRINQRLSSAYHPQTDGATERRNQEVETYLRSFVSFKQDDWASLLPTAEIALNNKPATTTGVSPFFLSHGYNAEPIAVQPSDLRSEGSEANPRVRAEKVVEKLTDVRTFAEAALAAAQQQQESYANRARDPQVAFRAGDKVWLHLRNIATKRQSKKLDWIHGKYTVTRAFPGNANFYELDVPTGVHNRFHVSLLRPASDDPLPSQTRLDPQPAPMQAPEGDEYGIEEILCCRSKKRGRGSRREALVKWTGYADPTWEPLSEFDGTAALDVFEGLHGDANHNDGPLADYQPSRRRRGVM